jgi:hypothetical protein
MVNLGWLYEQGGGVERSATEAAQWYSRAAELGSPEGLANLAVKPARVRDRSRVNARMRAHAQSRTETHAHAHARTRARRAHTRTHTHTQVCFLNGDGVEVDHAKAAELCVRAAKAGNTAAQLLLGLMLEEGVGTDPDPAGAVTWYKLAAHHGVRAAQFNLGSCYADGRGVERNDEVCARAQVRARVCGVRAVRLRRRHADGSRQQDKTPKRPSVRSSHAGVGGRRGIVLCDRPQRPCAARDARVASQALRRAARRIRPRAASGELWSSRR